MKSGNTVIRTIQGDITKVDFDDVIVNSVGSTAHSGKGVNAAILNAAGLNFNKYYIKELGTELTYLELRILTYMECEQKILTLTKNDLLPQSPIYFFIILF